MGEPSGMSHTFDKNEPVREIRCGKKAIDASALAEYQIASFFMYSSAACSPARTSAGLGPARIAMISPDSKPDECLAPA